MSNLCDRRIIQELHAQIIKSRGELLKILEEWHYLISNVQPKLLFLYESKFGAIEHEIKRKQELADSLDKKVEIYIANKRQSTRLTMDEVRFIENIYERQIELINKFKLQREKLCIKKINQPSTEKINDDFPKMYRQIVKRLHPDLIGDTENFRKFWYNVQEAYQNGDYNRIELFYNTLCSDREDEQRVNNIGDELKLRQELRQLRMNIAAERRKIRRALSSEPFNLIECIDDEQWIETKRKELKEKLSSLEQRIYRNKHILKSLTGKDYFSLELVSNPKQI